jgi:hypothetical protein
MAEQKRNECERQGQTPEDDSRQRRGQTPEDDSRQRRPSSPVLTTTDPEQGDESEDHPQQTKDTRRIYQAQDPETDRHPSRITELVQAQQQSKGYETATAQDATDEADERPQRPGFRISHPCTPPFAALHAAERVINLIDPPLEGLKVGTPDRLPARIIRSNPNCSGCGGSRRLVQVELGR